MAKIPAPSAKAFLSQATAAWPDRRRTSDGIVPSAAHTASSPSSDHEPGAAGYCHAVDLSHDPASGCDCGRITEALRVSRDSRIKYVIFNRRMFSSYATSSRAAWTWGAYSGSNPHDKHMHMSIIDTLAACVDTSQWPIGAGVAETGGEEMSVITLKQRDGWQTFWLMVAPGLADRIYTSNPDEVEKLANAKWSFGNEAFLVSTTDPTNTTPLHRFVIEGRHLLTASQAEADALKSAQYPYEGVVAMVGTGGVQVRRLLGGADHILTKNPDENPTGYTFESIAFGCGVAQSAPDPHPSDANEQIATYEARELKALALAHELVKLFTN